MGIEKISDIDNGTGITKLRCPGLPESLTCPLNLMSCLPAFLSEEARDVRDSVEKVKQALEEAQRAKTAASSAIQQATANIHNTSHLLSSVSLTVTSCLLHTAISYQKHAGNTSNARVVFRWSRRRQMLS